VVRRPSAGRFAHKSEARSALRSRGLQRFVWPRSNQTWRGGVAEIEFLQVNVVPSRVFQAVPQTRTTAESHAAFHP
jgi:hypothetical protein